MAAAAAQLTSRHRQILEYFPTALGVDDFIARVEIALCGYGFTGDNSIGEKFSCVVHALVKLRGINSCC